MTIKYAYQVDVFNICNSLQYVCNSHTQKLNSWMTLMIALLGHDGEQMLTVQCPASLLDLAELANNTLRIT